MTLRVARPASSDFPFQNDLMAGSGASIGYVAMKIRVEFQNDFKLADGSPTDSESGFEAIELSTEIPANSWHGVENFASTIAQLVDAVAWGPERGELLDAINNHLR